MQEFFDLKKLSYRRQILHSTETFEVVQCEWDRGSISPMHGHGFSECVVLVQEGRFENRDETEDGLKRHIFGPGEKFSTPLGSKHEICCLSESGKTLHIYVPRIQVNE